MSVERRSRAGHAQVGAGFLFDGHGYYRWSETVKLPVLSTTTTVVRGMYPPKVIDLLGAGRQPTDPTITVEGRRVYRDAMNFRLVTKTFRRAALLRPEVS